MGSSSFGLLVQFAVGVLLLSTGAAQRQPSAAPARATPVAVADAACAKCHKDIYNDYLRTPMANASGAAAKGALPGEFSHPASGVRFTVSAAQGETWLSYVRPPGPARIALDGRRRLEYFVGSGHRGRTYLSDVDGFWYEAPINWYTPAQRYDMRPGQQRATEVKFDLAARPLCLSCHTSAVQSPAPGTQNRYGALPFLHTGITCESCHGNTSQHVASAGRKPVVNPAKLDPARRDSVCEQCHLESEIAVEKPGKSKPAFVAGDKLSDYVSYFVHDSAPKAAVGAVTQVEALALSACKRGSGVKLSCITCHNPHDRPSQNRVQYFRAKCLNCHSAPKYASAHYPENPDCASCHMRRNQAGDIPHQQVTDHRILRVPEEAATLAVDRDPHALKPVLNAPLNDRDWGLAYAQLARTDATVIEIAYQYLRRAQAIYPRDADILSELAFLSEAKNLAQDAASYYQQTLKINPTNAFARSRLGLLYWRAGDAHKAISFWEPVFRRDPHFVGMNLAEAECSVGNRAASVAVLQRLVHFFPDRSEAKQRLDAIEDGSLDCGGS